jgi:hypothetical protein
VWRKTTRLIGDVGANKRPNSFEILTEIRLTVAGAQCSGHRRWQMKQLIGFLVLLPTTTPFAGTGAAVTPGWEQHLANRAETS